MSACYPHIFIPFATFLLALFALLGCAAGFIIGWVTRDRKQSQLDKEQKP